VPDPAVCVRVTLRAASSGRSGEAPFFFPSQLISARWFPEPRVPVGCLLALGKEYAGATILSAEFAPAASQSPAALKPNIESAAALSLWFSDLMNLLFLGLSAFLVVLYYLLHQLSNTILNTFRLTSTAKLLHRRQDPLLLPTYT